MNLLPATVGAISVFLLREPLIVLLRQRYVWADLKPETLAAQRSVWLFGGRVAVSGAWMLCVLPTRWLLALALIGALLTGVSVHGALRNRQRSPILQIAGAAGLASSAFVAYLATGHLPDETLMLLWAAHWLHSGGSVLVVHARLEAVRAARGGASPSPRVRAAFAWHAALMAVAMVLYLAGLRLLSVTLLFPLAIHLIDLFRLSEPSFLRTPLRIVGLRELAISIVFSVLVLWALC